MRSLRVCQSAWEREDWYFMVIFKEWRQRGRWTKFSPSNRSGSHNSQVIRNAPRLEKVEHYMIMYET